MQILSGTLRSTLHRQVNGQKKICELLQHPLFLNQLLLVKATSDTVFIAMDSQITDETSQEDVRLLLEFVCRAHSELQGVEGLQHRVVVSSGPVVGCVLGSRSVSFEYYGAAVCVASRLLEEVPWGSVAATSALLRSAVGCLDGCCPEDVDPESPVEYVVDVLPDAPALRSQWSASQRYQLASLPPCRLRLLLQLRTT